MKNNYFHYSFDILIMDHTIFSFPIVIVIATPLSAGRGKRKDVQVLSV